MRWRRILIIDSLFTQDFDKERYKVEVALCGRCKIAKLNSMSLSVMRIGGKIDFDRIEHIRNPGKENL